MTELRHVSDLLARWSEDEPDRVALIAPDGETRTFAELRARVEEIAGGLREAGFVPGDRVVLLLPMGIGLYEALLGLFHGGFVAVLIDPQTGLPRMEAALAAIGVQGLIGTRKAQLLRLAIPTLRRLKAAYCPGGLWPAARSLEGLRGARGGPLDPPAGEPALITFTTGSTGTPKAIGRSHAFLLAQHVVLRDHMGLGPKDRDLPTLPVFLLNSLGAGATCVLPDGDLRDVAALPFERVAEQIRRHEITTISGSPGFFEPLCAALGERPATSVRRVFVGGARVTPRVLSSMVAAFPASRIEVLYGSTEAEPMATLEAREALALADEEHRGAPVGRPVPGLEARIVDPDAGVDLPDGEPGELWVAGDHVNPGYYRNPAADAANKVREGGRIWHRTGDGAFRAADGMIWLVGRTSERVGAFWPFRVAALAEAVPGVSRAVLAPLKGGPTVVFEGEVAESTITAATGVPRAVRVGRIPLDARHRAKVDMAALRALLGEG